MKNLYRILIPVLLVIFAVTWIIFLDKMEEYEKDRYTNSTTSITPEAEPSATTQPSPLPTPTPTPEPTARPTIAPQPSSTPTPTLEPTPSPEPSVLFPYCTTKTSDSVIIYSGASEQYSEAGVLPGFEVAKITERRDNGWVKLTYQDITGYCPVSSLDMDDDALKDFREWGGLKIKSVGSNVNIRSEANTSCEVVGKSVYNNLYDYLPEFDEDGFYAISFEGKTCYISKDFASPVIKQ